MWGWRSVSAALAALALASSLVGTAAGAERLAAPPRDPRFGIDEGEKNQASKDTGIGWERLTFSWSAIQPNGPTDFRADLVFTPQQLAAELNSGVQVVGLLEFTPPWAQSNPSDGQRSVPKNLNLAWDDPNNYWGQFTRQMAAHYAGAIDTWIIWNEPEIRPSDNGNGPAWTWAGGPEDYLQLLRVAYKNIKLANPSAKVIFAGTAYWADKNAGREQFFQRVLDAYKSDSTARDSNFYFDAVAFNIYRAPDDIYRIPVEMKRLMRKYGIDKPLWLTETNAMPFDPAVPCAERFANNPSNVSLDVQAAYVVQALAMALAAGWDRIGWYQMTDSDSCAESAIWGLARDDGSLRPAYTAFKTAVQWLNGAQNVKFVPYDRETQAWGTPWPVNPDSYYPNWEVYQVVADRGDQRISILWNADGAPLRARIPKVGSSTVRIDKLGNQQPLEDVDGWYVVDLGPASARGPQDPNGYFFIGGDPVIIVQNGMPAGTPVAGPGLGDPGSQAREFKAFVSPANGQKITPGQAAQFTLDIRGFEGFSDPVSLSFKEYSTQRDPNPVASLPGTLSLDVPGSANPGDSITAVIQTAPNVAPGIHFVTLRLDGGGITRTVDLVVQVD